MKVSVIIPCKNEQDYIEDCINSIFNNTQLGFSLEVIVCDGLSNDNTPRILEKLKATYPKLKILLNKQVFTPHALNMGIQESEGDFIIIFGAHAVMRSKFITSCIEVLKEHPKVMCVGGLIHNSYSDLKSESIGFAMSSSFGVGNAHFRTGAKEGLVDTVAFGMYRKELFNKIGLFDVNLVRNQDDDFNFRITKNGFQIYLINQYLSDYFVRGSFSKLYSQYFQYGYWKVYVNRKHKAITTMRQLIPLFFVLYLFVLLGLLLIITKPYAWVLLSPMLLYFLCSLLIPYKMYLRKVKLGFWTSYTFFILHISYGLGYASGIYEFIIKNKRWSNKNIQDTR